MEEENNRKGNVIGASEASPLLTSADKYDSQSETDSPLLEGGDVVTRTDSLNATSEAYIERVLEKEIQEPWPASFERSVGLLASPYPVDARDIDLMTRSPLRSPALSITYRKAEKKPFQVGLNMLLRPFQGKKEDRKKAVQQSKVEALEDAKEYRKRILKQQEDLGIVTTLKRKEEVDTAALYSPGMIKEKRIHRVSRRKKEKLVEIEVDGKSTVPQCIFNLSNILMGMGLLALPFVYKCAGWLGGTAILVSFGFICSYTSLLIGRLLNGDPRPGHIFDDSPFKTPLPPGSDHKMARMLKPLKSFPQIARESFGDLGAIVLSVTLYFELFSCLAVYFVSLGDHMHNLVPILSMRAHMILMAFAVAAPTIILRTPTLLSYLSAVGTVATVFVVLSVCLVAITYGDMSEKVAFSAAEPPPYHVMWRPTGMPIALGLVAYCFSGHALIPSIYVTMKDPRMYERMATATFVLVLVCSLLVAISGYYTFGQTVVDQVTISLANAPIENGGQAMTLLTCLMVMTAFSKFALTMFPLALGMEELAAPFIVGEVSKEIASYVIRFSLIVMALFVAM